jgi:hypothetical protein
METFAKPLHASWFLYITVSTVSSSRDTVGRRVVASDATRQQFRSDQKQVFNLLKLHQGAATRPVLQQQSCRPPSDMLPCLPQWLR